ncbi:MAG: FHA domain-containing protein [Blastocatellia bacterium]|nr:FHA domain-containing protein [Blastocatellia bacterium]
MKETLSSLPNATLSYLDSAGQTHVVRIDTQAFTIGRLRSNNLQINDSYVSRQHAEIVYQDGHFILRDKNSTGGCIVNGHRVSEHVLEPGDQVQLGNTNPITLVFDINEDEPTTESSYSTQDDSTEKLMTIITHNQTRFLNTSLLDSAEYITDATLNRLKNLNDTTRKMLAVRSVKELFEVLIESVMTALPAERGVILMKNPATNQAEIQVERSRSESGGKVHPSRTIVDQVFHENVAIRSFDTMADNRFALNSSIIQQAIHSVMCAPISSNNRVWGVCYVDNLMAHMQFNDEELEYFLALTQQAGLAMENLHLIEELRATQEKLISQEKLATLGQFSSGIAHELKNQLTTLTAAEILMAVTQDQDLRKLIQLILNAQQRMLSMVNEIRDFAKQSGDSFVKELKPVVPVLEEALSFSRFDPVVKICRIETKFEANPEFYLNEDKLMQVILNLLRNAAQAMPQGGLISIRCLEIDNHTVISVRDTGCGISKEQINRIWDPFYTTKGAEGTGLGLGICRRIIEGHFGTITCQSELEKGTTFTITIPIPGEP